MNKEDAMPRAEDSSLDANKKVIIDLFENFWNRGDLAALESALHDSFRFRSANHPEGLDRAQYIETALSHRLTFPDVVGAIDELIAEGDQIAVQWTNSATHRGTFLGIPATGKKVIFAGISIFRIKDGKIVDGWGIWNPLEGFRQMITSS
jgi:steroid delta-isomerase-like uncharacterized protein